MDNNVHRKGKFVKIKKYPYFRLLGIVLSILIAAVTPVSCAKKTLVQDTKSTAIAAFDIALPEQAVTPDYFSSEKVDLALDLDGGYSIPIAMTECNGELAVLFRFIPADGESYARHYVATYNAQGNQLTLSELVGELSKKLLTDIRSDSDGNLLFIEWSSSGSTVYRYSVSEETMIDVKTLTLPDDFVNTGSFVVDSNGHFYLTADGSDGTNVFVYDTRGNLLVSELRAGINGVEFQFGNALYFEATGETIGQRILYPVDTVSAEFLSAVDCSEAFGNERVFFGSDYLCSMNSTGLYWFDSVTREKQTLILWEESGIDKALLGKYMDVAILSKEALFLLIETDSSEKELYVLNRQTTNPNAGKTTLVLASVNFFEVDMLNAAVKSFNDSNSEYKIVYQDYYPESEIDYSLPLEKIQEGRKDAYRQLYLDILSDNGPDMVIGLNRAIKESGLLVDLIPLIESDEDFALEDYLPNLIEASKEGNSLYSFPISFTLDCLEGKTSVIGDREGWTIEDFNQMAESLPEGMVPITIYSQSELLKQALSIPEAGYYRNDSSGMSFDNEALVSLLEWAKAYGIPDETAKENIENNEAYYYMEELISNEKLGLIDIGINRIGTIYSYYKWFAFGKSLTYIGFPSPNKLRPSANTLDFAITQQCKEPEVALEFIKTLLSEEIQSGIIRRGYSIPIRISSIELMIDFELNPENHPELVIPTDAESDPPDPDTETARKKYYQEIGIPVFEKLVFGVDSIIEPDEELIAIVQEEALAYFNDAKTAEEVAAIIRNRAKTLFDERST